MDINIIDYNEYFARKQSKSISVSSLFNKSGDVHPEGLISYEIFGEPGTKERKQVEAYIDLGEKFIHPHVLRELSFIPGGNNITKIIMGESYAYVSSSGELILIEEDKDAPDGMPKGIGTAFLYKNFDKIKYDATSKRYNDDAPDRRKSRLQFITSLKKDEFFLSKVLIIPAFYRDVNMQDSKNNEINTFYIKLINLASILKSSMMNIVEVSAVHIKIMHTLTELYQFFLSKTGGNKGFIHKYVMGKSTDFSARLVISAPSFNEDRPEDSDVSFTRSALPLFAFIKCFAPFIVHSIKEIVKNSIAEQKFIYKISKTGSITKYRLSPSYEEVFSVDNIYRLINLYTNSKEHRLDLFTVPTVEGEDLPFGYILNNDMIFNTDSPTDNVSELLKSEPLRLITLFYIASMNIKIEPIVYTTRHPIEDYNNIYPSKVNIIPYTRVEKRIINSVEYPRFPVIKYEEDMKQIDSMFTDSYQIFPSYLGALGADYDGDMVNVQGVYTKEAMDDANKFMNSTANIVNVAGKTMKEFDDVVSHTIYNLTLKT